MSRTAQKRDLTDPKTIDDFVAKVQTIDRLRFLAILTAVDIRAVGPGVWNSWKGQLLGELYDAAQERLRLGHKRRGRAERVEARRTAVREMLGPQSHLVDTVGSMLSDAYWIAESEDIIARNLQQYEESQAADDRLSIRCDVDEERGATVVSVIAQDHPGLFYRIAGGIHLAGAHIIDARIHTASNGTAFDNLLVQDRHRQPFSEDTQIGRLKKGVRDALMANLELVQKLAARPLRHSRSKAFEIAPSLYRDRSQRARSSCSAQSTSLRAVQSQFDRPFGARYGLWRKRG